MKSGSRKRAPNIENLTVKRRYLTEREIERLPSSFPSAAGHDGHDTRALQHYLGHKNIQHTHGEKAIAKVRAWRNPSARRKSPPRSGGYASHAIVRLGCQSFAKRTAGDASFWACIHIAQMSAFPQTRH